MKKLNIYLVISFISFISDFFSQNAVLTKSPGRINSKSALEFVNNGKLFYGSDWTSYWPGGEPLLVNKSIRSYSLDDFSDSEVNNKIFSYLGYGLGSVKINNIVYTIQGNNLYKIDLITGKKIDLQNFPSKFIYGRGCVLTDSVRYLYLFGGWTKEDFYPNKIIHSNELWRYDIINNVWSLHSKAPSGMTFNSGAFIYPNLYFGGGRENDKLLKFNLIDNSWSYLNIPILTKTTQLGTATIQNETYFSVNGVLKCYLGRSYDVKNMIGPEIWTYNDVINDWSFIKVQTFDGGIGLTSSNIGLESGLYVNYVKIIPIDSLNYFVLEDESMFNTISSKTSSDYFLSLLSLKNKQIHVKINNTDCIDTLNAKELNVNFSVQFTGDFSKSTININVNDLYGNTIKIKTLTDFNSTGQQVLNFNEVIPISYISGNINVEVIENNFKTFSINKYPIRKNISNIIKDSIISSNGSVFCNGSQVGSILSVNNNPNYKYQWFYNGNTLTGEITNKLTASKIGIYSCLITPTNNCSIQPMIELKNLILKKPTITLDGDSIFCTGGSIKLSTENISGLSYLWKLNGQNFQNNQSSSVIVSQSGNYSVTVSNANCSYTSNIKSISTLPKPIITGNLTLCENSSTILKGSDTPSSVNSWVSSNTNVASIDNQGVIISVSAGSSIITYTNSNGCMNTTNISVLPKPSLTIPSTICQGISMTFKASDLPSSLNPWFSSDNNVATINGYGVITTLAPGTASITYTNSNSCSNNATINIIAKPAIIGATSFCEGITSSLKSNDISSSFDPWSSSNTNVLSIDNQGVVKPLNIGTSIITFKNSNGCTNNVSVSIIPKPIIIGSSSLCEGVSTIFMCTDTPSSLNPWSSSNTNIALIDNKGTINPITIGSSVITFTNSNGCSNELLIKVLEKPTLGVGLPLSDICQGGTSASMGGFISGNASGGYWSGGAGKWTNASNPATATYTASDTEVGLINLTLTSSGGNCSVSVNKTINIISKSKKPTDTNCWDSYVYNTTTCSWINEGSKPNKPSIINCWDNYEFNSNTCSWVNTGTQPSQPSTVNCWDNYEFNSTTCSWVNTGTQPNKPSKINCWDEYLFNNSTCSWYLSGDKPLILGELTICEGSSSLIKSSDVHTAINPWVISDISIATVSDNGLLKGLKAGTTVITYTNSLNCSVNSVVNILKSPNKPIISSNGNTSFCSGDSILLISSYNKGNLWSNNSINSSIYVSENGVYSLVFTDVNGCKSESEPITVKVLPLPNVKIFSSGSTNLCDGDKLTLSSSFSNGYLWSNASTNQSIIIEKSGKYYVTVIGQNGCSSTSDTVEVHFNQPSTSSIDIIGDDSVFVNEIKYITSGIYYQNFKNKNGCDSTIQVNVKINKTNLGLMELDLTNICYPNPVTDLLVIYNENKRFKSFIIEDLSGKKITQGYLNVNENYIDLKNISPGCYNLIFNEQNKPVRLIKN